MKCCEKRKIKTLLDNFFVLGNIFSEFDFGWCALQDNYRRAFFRRIGEPNLTLH